MRPFRESDIDAYHAVLQSGPVRRALFLPDTVSRDEAWQQMAAFLGQWELRNHGQWALVEKATGAFIGRAGPHRPERADWPGIEVGWTLHPVGVGQGIRDRSGPRGRALDVRQPPADRRALQRDPADEHAVAERREAPRLRAHGRTSPRVLPDAARTASGSCRAWQRWQTTATGSDGDVELLGDLRRDDVFAGGGRHVHAVVVVVDDRRAASRHEARSRRRASGRRRRARASR